MQLPCSGSALAPLCTSTARPAHVGTRACDGAPLPHFFPSRDHLWMACCSLNRWAQAGKGGDASLGPEAEALPPHEWPSEPHPKLSTHALREGQVQLLCKKDPGSGNGIVESRSMWAGAEEGGDSRPSGDITGPGEGLEGRTDGRTQPMGTVSCSHSGVLPPGTELPGLPGAGVMLTCSDKLALWSALGVQVTGGDLMLVPL